ncbi:YfdX family protein [Methylosarcina fibrata]|uniref:YfdX family protein n=1 Tax=Methylosarcina fibrata TaxID=105972 RepID=UPI00035C39BF|nr:YfdX family protein [Methylosarcina fibrata]
MNDLINKRTNAAIAAALAVSAGLSFPINAPAAPRTPATVSSSASSQPKDSRETERRLLKEREQNIDVEAKDVIMGIRNALIALQKNNSNEALTSLRQVSDKLNAVLAKYPAAGLLPAQVEADIYDFDGDDKQAQKMIDRAEDLLDDDRVQEARRVLADLVSEIRITTTAIPLATFPAAIKEATALIDQGKTEEARDALYDVLNLLVDTTEIMPLPVLRAEALLTKAAELEHKKDLSQEASRKEILDLAEAAKEKLKLAETLGYGSKDDYKELYDAIDDMKDVIHTEKSAAIWARIKDSFSAIKNKIVHPAK